MQLLEVEWLLMRNLLNLTFLANLIVPSVMVICMVIGKLGWPHGGRVYVLYSLHFSLRPESPHDILSYPEHCILTVHIKSDNRQAGRRKCMQIDTKVAGAPLCSLGEGTHVQGILYMLMPINKFLN